MRGQYKEQDNVKIMNENQNIFKKGRKNYSKQNYEIDKQEGNAFIVKDSHGNEKKKYPF